MPPVPRQRSSSTPARRRHADAQRQLKLPPASDRRGRSGQLVSRRPPRQRNAYAIVHVQRAGQQSLPSILRPTRSRSCAPPVTIAHALVAQPSRGLEDISIAITAWVARNLDRHRPIGHRDRAAGERTLYLVMAARWLVAACRHSHHWRRLAGLSPPPTSTAPRASRSPSTDDLGAVSAPATEVIHSSPVMTLRHHPPRPQALRRAGRHDPVDQPWSRSRRRGTR